MNDADKQTFINHHVTAAADRRRLARRLNKLLPCGWLVPADQAESGKTSATQPPSAWVGGLPALAADQSWPEQGGERLPYLLRIDLAALPDGLGIPDSGVLHVFGAFAGVRLMVTPEGAAVREIPTDDRPYCDGVPGVGPRRFPRYILQ